MPIAHEHLQQHGTGRKDQSVFVPQAAHHEIGRLGHRRDVGSDVDDVGDQQKGDETEQNVAAIKGLGIGGDPLAGGAADMGADKLNGDHERRREEDRPEQAKAKLSAGLRIGGDAGWIVIGRAGDQSRPQLGQQRRLLSRVIQPLLPIHIGTMQMAC